MERGVGRGLHAELVLEEALAVVGDDDVDLVSELDEVGDESLGVGGAGGAGDADDDTLGAVGVVLVGVVGGVVWCGIHLG